MLRPFVNTNKRLTKGALLWLVSITQFNRAVSHHRLCLAIKQSLILTFFIRKPVSFVCRTRLLRYHPVYHLCSGSSERHGTHTSTQPQFKYFWFESCPLLIRSNVKSWHVVCSSLLYGGSILRLTSWRTWKLRKEVSNSME